VWRRWRLFRNGEGVENESERGRRNCSPDKGEGTWKKRRDYIEWQVRLGLNAGTKSKLMNIGPFSRSDGGRALRILRFPSFGFRGIRMSCGLRMHPLGEESRWNFGPNPVCSFFPPTALRCLLVTGKPDDD
jgi:hypothetical protein